MSRNNLTLKLPPRVCRRSLYAAEYRTADWRSCTYLELFHSALCLRQAHHHTCSPGAPKCQVAAWHVCITASGFISSCTSLYSNSAAVVDQLAGRGVRLTSDHTTSRPTTDKITLSSWKCSILPLWMLWPVMILMNTCSYMHAVYINPLAGNGIWTT